MEVVTGIMDLYHLVHQPRNQNTSGADTNSSNSSGCQSVVNIKESLVFYYLMIPAGLFIFVLSLVKSRTAWRRNFWKGRPSMPCPVNCLEEKNDRLSYVAAFGLITWMLYDSLFGNDAFGWQHNTYFENFLLLASAFLVGILCYPIFGAIYSRHWLGYIVGSLYTWAITFVYILVNLPCENQDVVHQTLEVLWSLPPAVSLLYLSFNMPWRVIKCFLDWKRKKRREEYVVRNQHLYEVQHVKRLLDSNYMLGREEEDAEALDKKIYKNVKAFRYSITILTAVIVSIQFICMLNLQLIEKYLDKASALDIWVEQARNIVQTVVVVDQNVTNSSSNTDAAHITLLLLELSLRVLRTMSPALITCWCLAFVVTTLSLLMSLKRYRAHLLSIYKGDWSSIPKFDDMHPRTLVVSSAKFAGYQLGYAAWGFLVQSTVFIAVAVFCMAFILLVKEYDMSFLLVELAKWAGPLLLYLAFIYVTQILLTHFCFLQKDESGERVLALDNRKFFFNFHYFMIFGNAGLGVMSSILRVLKAVIYGLWVLPRLDMSTLGREFEQFDSGFAAYVAQLKVENAQTNPVLVVFANLLLDAPPRRKVQCVREWADSLNDIAGQEGFKEKFRVGCEHCRRIKRALIRNRWCLLITLHNNPGLRQRRKNTRRNSGQLSARGSTIFLDLVTDALDLFVQNV